MFSQVKISGFKETRIQRSSTCEANHQGMTRLALISSFKQSNQEGNFYNTDSLCDVRENPYLASISTWAHSFEVNGKDILQLQGWNYSNIPALRHWPRNTIQTKHHTTFGCKSLRGRLEFIITQHQRWHVNESCFGHRLDDAVTQEGRKIFWRVQVFLTF